MTGQSSVTDRVQEILREVRPVRKRAQVRQIWAEIELLREAGLTYKEIAAQLDKFGVTLTYKQFVAACWAIRKKKPAAGQQQDRKDKGDVLKNAQAKLQKSRESLFKPVDV